MRNKSFLMTFMLILISLSISFAQTAYITNANNNTVSVVDIVTNTVGATIPVGNYPLGVSTSLDGTKVYITNNADNTVSVINTANNTVSGKIAVGGNPLAFGNFISTHKIITTDISQSKNVNSFSIYPNPFSSITTLHADESLINATLAVYNPLGQVVKEIKNISGEEIVLHRDDLSDGIYFVSINQNNEILFKDKLIIKNN